ncbi:MAG: MFS transporter [Deltaproteobacteria bacterium]|nr:MFS transporter [Deltaproteobacteria bacterium]MBW2417899.1 MFS transporter [Deltaproteobacteria bacterium]
MTERAFTAPETLAPSESGGAPAAPLMSRGFAVVLVTQAAFGYAFSSFFLLPKFLATELAVGPAEVGLLGAVSSVATVIGMFGAGAWVDRVGRRPLLSAGALVMALSCVAFIAVEEMGPLVYLLRLLQSLAFALVYVAGAALTVDRTPPERLGQALGYFGLTMLSMNAVAPAMVEELAATRGWAWAFASAGLAALICLALSRCISEPPRRASTGEGNAGMAEVSLRPAALRAGLVMLLVGAAFSTMFTYYQLFALELGIEELWVFFVAYSAAAMFVRLALGGLGDRWGRRRLSVAILLVYAFSVLAMTELARIGLAPIAALFGIAHGLFYPAYSALAAEETPARDRGKVLALLQAWFNAGVAGSCYGLGVLAEARGYPVIFVVSAVCVFAAWGVVCFSPWASRILRSNRGM